MTAITRERLDALERHVTERLNHAITESNDDEIAHYTHTLAEIIALRAEVGLE